MLSVFFLTHKSDQSLDNEYSKITGFAFIQMFGTKGVLFFPPSARSQACANRTVGKKEGEQARADKKRVERSRERERWGWGGRKKRKEMIYCKSYVGRGLLLLRVSPTSLSLSLLYL